MSEQPFPPQLTQLNQTMAAMSANIHDCLQAVARQLNLAFEPLRPIVAYFEEHPEELEALRRQNELQAALEEQACHCLCGLHRDRADTVCQGYTAERLTVTRYSLTVGTVHVPMCRPCFEAAVA